MTMNHPTDGDDPCFQTTDSRPEPEYVGAYGESIYDQCTGIHGDVLEDLEYCDRDATHTVVERSLRGNLLEKPMCDDCGKPDDV